MMERTLTLLCAALLAALGASADAMDRNASPAFDRAVVTPHSVGQVTAPEPSVPAGVPALPPAVDPLTGAPLSSIGASGPLPNLDVPANVSESAPQNAGREHAAPFGRGDDRNLPNPRTASGVNEAAPDETGHRYTERSGMPGEPPIGATR